MKTKIYFMILLISGITLLSCEEEKLITREAILSWQGDYAVDGCGFFIELDNKKYKPENENNISAEFKSNQPVHVNLSFEYSENKIQYSCGDWSMKEIDGIKIISIKKL